MVRNSVFLSTVLLGVVRASAGAEAAICSESDTTCADQTTLLQTRMKEEVLPATDELEEPSLVKASLQEAGPSMSDISAQQDEMFGAKGEDEEGEDDNVEAPAPAPTCWTSHKFSQTVGTGSIFGFLGLNDAQKKCSDLGLSKCRAVTCRGIGCTGHGSSTLQRSGHAYTTYLPCSIGAFRKNSCPTGTVPMSSAHLCKSAAASLGKSYVRARSWRKFPKGCMTNKKNRVFYNTHKRGRARKNWKTICELGPSQAPAPAPTPPPRHSDSSKCMDSNCCKVYGRPQCKDNFRPMVVGTCTIPGLPGFVKPKKYVCVAPISGGWLESENEVDAIDKLPNLVEASLQEASPSMSDIAAQQDEMSGAKEEDEEDEEGEEINPVNASGLPK